MDSEILGTERAHHRRARVIYRTAAGALGILAIFGLIYAGFLTSPRSGWIVLIGILVSIAVILFLVWYLDRPKPGHLSSGGPWSYGQVYSGHQQREIWNSMGKVLVGYGMSFDRVTDTTALATRPGAWLYRKGHHLIDVRPSGDHPGWLVVTVFSRPDIPTTITDFGRGSGVNHDLLEAVPGHRPPNDPELD